MHQKTNLTIYFFNLFVFCFLICTNANAASKEEIDIQVLASLEKYKQEILGAEKFLDKAEGVLVFPNVVKAGFGIGVNTAKAHYW